MLLSDFKYWKLKKKSPQKLGNWILKILFRISKNLHQYKFIYFEHLLCKCFYQYKLINVGKCLFWNLFGNSSFSSIRIWFVCLQIRFCCRRGGWSCWWWACGSWRCWRGWPWRCTPTKQAALRCPRTPTTKSEFRPRRECSAGIRSRPTTTRTSTATAAASASTTNRRWVTCTFSWIEKQQEKNSSNLLFYREEILFRGWDF